MENKLTVISRKPLVVETQFGNGNTLQMTLHKGWNPCLVEYIETNDFKDGYVFTKEDFEKLANNIIGERKPTVMDYLIN